MADNPDTVKDIPNLKPSHTPRFCDEVRFMKLPYSKYFKKVFKNNTFRIYKVLLVSENEKEEEKKITI